MERRDTLQKGRENSSDISRFHYFSLALSIPNNF